MGWKTILVKYANFLSLKNNSLLVKDGKTQEIKKFFLEDINAIVVENINILISARLLSKITKYHIFLIICDESHDPQGLYLPMYENYNIPETLFQQIEVPQKEKHLLWTKIIKSKIQNQRIVLENNNVLEIDDLKKFFNYEKNVKINDISNCEGHSAKLFFKNMYGSQFVRFADDGINKGLNYGYKILASCISRSLAEYGINSCLGIWHQSKTNYFNLAYDLMEPFRPLVDEIIVQNIEYIDDKIPYSVRYKLVSILNTIVRINNQKTNVFVAIKLMVKSYVTFLKNKNFNFVILPEIIRKNSNDLQF